jgi:hypothetical protein
MSVGVMKDYKLHETILLPFFVCLLSFFLSMQKKNAVLRLICHLGHLYLFRVSCVQDVLHLL